MKNLEMELISSRFPPSFAHATFTGKKKMEAVNFPVRQGSFRKFSIVVQWKKDRYQDFQGYAKPVRLLPADGAKPCTSGSPKKLVELFPFEDYESLYRLKLKTSKTFGSDLTDLNSGILLCFIGENASSVLQRLPAAVSETEASLGNMEMHDGLHFQRGSVDEFAFKGPNLGKIAAVWVGLESGQWRIDGMNLTVFSHLPCQDDQPLETNNPEYKLPSSSCYHFEIDDILLGGNSNASMMEFRPKSVTASSDSFALLDENPSNASSEESMEEYADLKLSLLLYDAVLVLSGASIISFASENNALYPFLAGGFIGFLYLFLLQRSVDGLPVPKLIQGENKPNFTQVLETLRIPIAALALAILTTKFTPADDAIKLTPEDLIFGMLGFLMCKVAVILAAFKPLQLSLKHSKRSS